MTAETPISSQLKDGEIKQKSALEVRESMQQEKKEYNPKKLDSADKETKNELSRKWIQKLGIGETSIQQILARVGAESLYDDDLAEKVIKFQQEKKLNSKNGIIGWETLEALDSEIQFDKDDQTTKYDFSKAKENAQTKKEAPSIEKVISEYGAPGDPILDPKAAGLDPSYSYIRTEDSIQRTKDGQTEVWDTTGKKWTKEGESSAPSDKPTESQIADIERAAGYSGAVGDTIDAAGYNLDPAYNYTIAEGNTIQRTKDGQTEVWDTTGKKWENTEARDIRLAQEAEKKLYEEHSEDTKITDKDYRTKEDNDSFWNSSLENLKLSEVKDEIAGSDDFSDTERDRVNRIIDNIDDDMGRLGDITMGQYLSYSRNPVLAAERYAPIDKPGKLPGKLGEYGATYQQGTLRRPDGSARENTFVYKEGKVPQVIVDGEAKNINQVYTAPGVYKLPNGDLYRVSMNNEGVAKMAKVEKEDGSGTVANVDSNGNLNKVS